MQNHNKKSRQTIAKINKIKKELNFSPKKNGKQKLF